MATRLAISVSFALACGLVSGCKRTKAPLGPQPPGVATTDMKPRSELGSAIQRLISAAADGDAASVASWMTPRLRLRVSDENVRNALTRLREGFGEPRGIIEEQTHHEGELTWYSALVLYATEATPSVLTPVLFQFALAPDDGLDRLLIREHWFIENVEHPAEAYLPVNRFHLPTRGRWYVLHGGPTRPTNKHHGSTAQRYAYDLVMKKDGRQRPRGSDRNANASYYGHGVELLAPAAGVVVRAINDIPENIPPGTGVKGGNGMVIDHGFGEYSALWHAIPGSLTVSKGDRVEAGQVIARVGNSGRSTGPHIHFHVSYRPDGWNEAFGLPVEFLDVYVDGTWSAHEMPVRGQYVRRAVEGPPKAPAAAASARGPQVILSF